MTTPTPQPDKVETKTPLTDALVIELGAKIGCDVITTSDACLGLEKHARTLELKLADANEKLEAARRERDELAAWKAAEQPVMLSMATRLLLAGFKGEKLINGVVWIISERDSALSKVGELEKALEAARLNAECNKDYEAVYWSINNAARNVIEKYKLSKVYDAGSLKADEADSFDSIVDAHIADLQQERTSLQKAHQKLMDAVRLYVTAESGDPSLKGHYENLEQVFKDLVAGKID